MPAGPDYYFARDGRAALAEAWERVANDPDRFSTAQTALSVFESELDRGQTQLFDAAQTWRSRFDAETWRALWGIEASH